MMKTYNPFMSAALDQGFNATLASAMAPRALVSADPIRAEWDRALGDYMRLSALLQADNDFGAFYEANDDYDAVKADLEANFGKGFRNEPKAQCWLVESQKAFRDAEQAFSDNFERPLWEAERKCALVYVVQKLVEIIFPSATAAAA